MPAGEHRSRSSDRRLFAGFGHTSLAEHVAGFWEPFFVRCDANNLLCQLWTWEHGDISDNAQYGGSLRKALAAISARTIVLPVNHDRYFPPADSALEARHIPKGELRVIKSHWGHMAPMNPGDVPAIDAVLNELLA